MLQSIELPTSNVLTSLVAKDAEGKTRAAFTMSENGMIETFNGTSHIMIPDYYFVVLYHFDIASAECDSENGMDYLTSHDGKFESGKDEMDEMPDEYRDTLFYFGTSCHAGTIDESVTCEMNLFIRICSKYGLTISSDFSVNYRKV